MKSTALGFLLGCVVFVAVVVSSMSSGTGAISAPPVGIRASECNVEFLKWARAHQKNYESAQERSKRRAVFCDKLAWIREQNEHEQSFKR